MAVYVHTIVGVYVDGLAVHGFAEKLSLEGSADEKIFTNLASNGWHIKKVGLAQYSLDVGGFDDYAATGIATVLKPVTNIGNASVFTVAPTTLGATVADPVFMGQGYLLHTDPMMGAVGDEARIELGWKGDAQLVRGQVVHPEAARTASGNGTATALVPPTATQSIYGHFHLLSVSGAGTITFQVQTDDLVGMASPVTRLTSQAFAATGAQRVSAAGSLAGEVFVRVIWTIAGFTSCTFSVAVGVG